MLESCCIAQNSQDMHSEPGLVQIEAYTPLRSSHLARRRHFKSILLTSGPGAPVRANPGSPYMFL